VLALVAAGCGVALVPRMAAAGPAWGAALRPLAGPGRPGRHLYAAIRAGSERHPCLAPVLEALRRSAQEQLGQPRLPRQKAPLPRAAK